MVTFVDEARAKAQTGGKRHPGTDGVAAIEHIWHS